MKAGILIAIFGASGLIAGDEPRDASRYDVIARRNAFGLQAAPSVPATAPPGASETWKPPPDLKLTGVVCFPRMKAASLYLVEHGKPPASYVLAEGEARDGIELVEINPSAETVRVKNQGVFVVLSFQTHGLKPNENVGR
jgi:hypothetical protein